MLSRLSALLVLLLLSGLPAANQVLAAACPDLDGAAARQRMEGLGVEIRYHNRLYYQEMKPEISDAQYDRLVAELVRLEECFPGSAAPDSPTQRVGGASEEGKSTVAHERPMLSLSSSSAPDQVEAVLRRAGAAAGEVALIVQPKVDGLPVELVYIEGSLVSAATRGDGQEGEEVTGRAREIRGIPVELSGTFPPRLAVRGEVYADLQLYRAGESGWSAGYATPRHLAAAALRAEHPDPRSVAALRLFPFEWVNPGSGGDAPGTDLSALQQLRDWGFTVPREHTHRAQTLEEVRTVYQRYLRQREGQPFAMDGIVVKVDSLALRNRLGQGSRAPFWAAAWKFPPATAQTRVRAIRWSVGRTGRRTPVAEVAPVALGGVQVERVSLHSPAEVTRLGLEEGDQVVVALVGDVIPQVMEVVGKTPGPLQENHQGMDEPIAAPDGCLKDSAECREQFVARLTHFASRAGLGITGLGRGRIEGLVGAGLVKDLPALFELQAGEIAAVPGFGEQSAAKLVASIGAARQPALHRLVAALGIPGVGEVTARRLGTHFTTMEELLAADQQALHAVPGVGAATAGSIRSFFASPGGRELVERLRELGLGGAG